MAPWPRLVTMIGMLIVLLMIMSRARQPSTWRWLTNEPLSESPAIATARQAESDSPAGPTDLDPDEADAAREEFQAVSDRATLQPEEMPIYWRLVRWVRHQSSQQLQQRSSKGVRFTDLVERPDKWRGKLIHLRLHLRESRVLDIDDSPIGVTQLYEAWGWTDDSQPWMHVIVFPEKPQGMPIGKDAWAEASFNGYFMKLMPYEAREGRSRVAPLLLGRLVWHPIPATTGTSSTIWFWLTIALGGLIGLLIVARWLVVSRSTQLTSGVVREQSIGFEEWLTNAQSGAVSSDRGDSADSSASESEPDSWPGRHEDRPGA